ncbi:HD domain-containing phosphohydrolase [Pseudomonadota bacterium]
MSTLNAVAPAGAMIGANAEVYSERKRLFLIDAVGNRAQQLSRALNPLYEVSIFGDGAAALDAMHACPPDLVVIDEGTMNSHGHGIHRTKVRDSQLKHVPFIILSNTTAGELMLGDGDGAPDHFLKRPFSFKMLLEQMSYAISYSVEKTWKSLAPSAQTTLKASVSQFKDITQAIAEGRPPDMKETSEACRPLVKSIQDNEYGDVLDGLRDHHNYTYVHSLRVATYLTVFGKAVGMGANEMLLLTSGGMLHDVGKITMPQTLLNKPGKLDDQEWDVMRNHVVESDDIITTMEEVNPVIAIIAGQHHEKIDGTGYPHGLKGSQLNELARMATIVDIFSALTDSRSYKPAFSTEKSFAILKDMGGGLDQRLVEKFEEVVCD